MPRRRDIPIEPDISRKDIADAIQDLSNRLLDPDRPSLFSTMNARFDDHEEAVKKIVNQFNEFVERDYKPFKEDYMKVKNRGLGWLAGAGAVGGSVVAVLKHFLFGK